MAISAMDQVVSLLLVPERCARLNEQGRLDSSQLNLMEVLDDLGETAFDRRARTERLRSLQRGLQSVFVTRMIERARTDLPHPLSPTRPIVWPRLTLKSTPLTARTTPWSRKK